jgi:hypothetical protein
MVSAREVLVHSLSGGGADGVRILPNLVCDIEQGNHDGSRPYDLSKIGKVSKVHAPPNEIKLSDGYRKRAPIEVGMF